MGVTNSRRGVILPTVAMETKANAATMTELAWLSEVRESGPRLAYLVSVPNEQPMGDWLVFVDAQSGAILGREDRMMYATGSGRVFDPDPRTKLNDASLIDNSDADSAVPFPSAYDTRTLNDITNTAGTYSLSGPYARIIDFESPVIAQRHWPRLTCARRINRSRRRSPR